MPIRYTFLSLLLLFVISASAQNKQEPKEPATIFTYVDQLPNPDYDVSRYIRKHTHYPDSARKHNIEGRVIVRFIVNEDGHISDCVILRGFDAGCDKEALR